MKKILVSACLLGVTCRYDGKSIECPAIEELRKKYDLVPFCPEVEGGLKCPRDPCEIRHNRAYTKKGEDLTKYYQLGALKALKLCEFLNIEVAILKENSPSCGTHRIHNGMFDGKLIDGKGYTARLLEANGIRCYNEETLFDFLVEEKKREDALHEAFLAREAKKAERKAALEEAQKAKEEKEREAKEAEATSIEVSRFTRRPYGLRTSNGKKPYGRKPFRKGKPYGEKGKSGGKKPYFKHSGKAKPYGKKSAYSGRRPYKKAD